MIKKVLITTFSAAAVLAAGIGFSGVTANAATYQGQAQSYHYQPQTSTYSTNAPARNTSVSASQTPSTYGTTGSTSTSSTGTTSSSSTSTSSSSTSSSASGATITESQFESQGVVYLNGNKWTYYSGSVTADGTQISSNGLDPNGYRVVAAPSNVAFGTKIMTPLGMGVVHDRGTAITGNHYDVVIQ